MADPYSITSTVCALFGLVLAIPPNTCIVIVNLQSLREEGKLSTPDVIFMVKGMVNILLQGFIALLVLLYAFFSGLLYTRGVFVFVNTSVYTLTYFSFWMTAWLSAHYYTNITNLRNGFFIWWKRIVSNYLCLILFLTALGMFIINVLSFLDLNVEGALQTSENITEVSIIKLHVSLPSLLSVTFLGVILPFCLSLLCLLLTFSFLVRHVWRVKNNDSGSSRPNLQAHVNALRTIFLLLFVFTLFYITQALRFIRIAVQLENAILVISWNLQILSPPFEAVVIFQASSKLKRVILRRFWSRKLRDIEN